MKKRMISVVAFCVLSALFVPLCAQTTETEEKPIKVQIVEEEDTAHLLLTPDFLGIFAGYYGIGFDIKLSDHIALYLDPGYFNVALMPVFGTLFEDDDLSIWYFKMNAGVTFFPKEMFNGFFVRGYARGQVFSMTIEGENGKLASIGIGGQIGVTITKRIISWTFAGGVEYLKGFVTAGDTGTYQSISSLRDEIGTDGAMACSFFGIDGIRPTLTAAISFAL